MVKYVMVTQELCDKLWLFKKQSNDLTIPQVAAITGISMNPATKLKKALDIAENSKELYQAYHSKECKVNTPDKDVLIKIDMIEQKLSGMNLLIKQLTDQHEILVDIQTKVKYLIDEWLRQDGLQK